MDAPIWEMIIRLMTAGISLFAFASVFTLWRMQHKYLHPVRHLTAFMAFVLFVLFLDRSYIVWVGLQHDHDGMYATNIEPVVRAVGASLLGLVLLGAGLLAVFTIRQWKYYDEQ